MNAYILRRLVLLFPTVFLVGSILFVTTRMLPGDAALLQLAESGRVTPDRVEAVRAELGLDRPLVIQYVDWWLGVARGDLGSSFVTGRDALGEVMARLPLTLELAILSLTVGIFLGVPLGVVSGWSAGGPIDTVGRIVSSALVAIPEFWLATLLVVFPAIWWQWSPPVSYVSFVDDPLTNLQQLALPVLALGAGMSASIIRLGRSAVLEVARSDYIRTAYAKGLSSRNVLARHAMKNALVPIITLIGLRAAFVLGGTVVIEQVFSLPGMGRLLLTAISQRDYAIAQAVVLVFAISVILINIVVDLLYAYVDPRVRLGR